MQFCHNFSHSETELPPKKIKAFVDCTDQHKSDHDDIWKQMSASKENSANLTQNKILNRTIQVQQGRLLHICQPTEIMSSIALIEQYILKGNKSVAEE